MLQKIESVSPIFPVNQSLPIQFMIDNCYHAPKIRPDTKNKTNYLKLKIKL